MSNQVSKTLVAISIIATLLLTYTATGALSSTFMSIDAQSDKAAKEKAAKLKKVTQKVKITGDVDITQVENITEASKAYSFVVQSGAYTSKPKALELSNGTSIGEQTGDTIKVVFAGKLAVSVNDGFSITAVSNSTEYQTVVGTGVFEQDNEQKGKSGKVSLSGVLEEPLVLQGIDSGIEELN